MEVILNWKKVTIYNFIEWCKEHKNVDNFLDLILLPSKQIKIYIHEFCEMSVLDDSGDFGEFSNQNKIDIDDIIDFLIEIFI